MQLRFLVCIPVYNHPKSINEIIEGCLKDQEHPVLVVDDGSDVSVEESYLKSYPHQTRISFLRHTENKGKGAAIQSAIEWAVQHEFTHLITIDADGQHFTKDILNLIQFSYQHQWSVILGDRQMQTENVPKSSVFGKAFSNFWVKYQTDKIVGDSQSGFRIYPLFYLQTMKFLTKRYDFEVEILTRLIWRNVEVVSVPIQVKYFPSEQRVTHFNKLKDNFRLTVLNTILVSASLLKRKDSPFKSALAVALGVFVGCIPIYGAHTLIVAIIALLFRMNFIYLWLGTHISFPPFVPFLLLGAKFIATLYLHHAPLGFIGFSHDWLIGIFGFALIASSVFFVLVYSIKKTAENRLHRESNKNVSAQSRSGLGVEILKSVLKIFGLKATYFCLYFVTSFYFLFSLKSRKSISQYARVLNPKLGYLPRQKFHFHILFRFAQILVDRAFQKQGSGFQFEMIEGQGIKLFAERIRTEKTGHIIVQSHMGGWEMAMPYFRRLKFDKKLMAVMYGNSGTYQHTSMNEKDKNVQVAHFNKQSDTIIRLKKFLDQQDIIGLMGDRPVGRSYELKSFCGKLALFDTTPARLALLSGAQIYLLFCFKIETTKYYIDIVCLDLQKDPAFSNLKKEEKIKKYLDIYTQELERRLSKYPEQWFNFYPFWSEMTF